MELAKVELTENILNKLCFPAPAVIQNKILPLDNLVVWFGFFFVCLQTSKQQQQQQSAFNAQQTRQINCKLLHKPYF